MPAAAAILPFARVADLLQQVHVAFVGGEDVHRDRRQRRVARRLENDRLAAMVETQPAPFAPDMRRQQAGAFRERDQFEAELVRSARARPAADPSPAA